MQAQITRSPSLVSAYYSIEGSQEAPESPVSPDVDLNYVTNYVDDLAKMLKQRASLSTTESTPETTFTPTFTTTPDTPSTAPSSSHDSMQIYIRSITIKAPRKIGRAATWVYEVEVSKCTVAGRSTKKDVYALDRSWSDFLGFSDELSQSFSGPDFRGRQKPIPQIYETKSKAALNDLSVLFFKHINTNRQKQIQTFCNALTADASMAYHPSTLRFFSSSYKAPARRPPPRSQSRMEPSRPATQMAHDSRSAYQRNCSTPLPSSAPRVPARSAQRNCTSPVTEIEKKHSLFHALKNSKSLQDLRFSASRQQHRQKPPPLPSHTLSTTTPPASAPASSSSITMVTPTPDNPSDTSESLLPAAPIPAHLVLNSSPLDYYTEYSKHKPSATAHPEDWPTDTPTTSFLNMDEELPRNRLTSFRHALKKGNASCPDLNRRRMLDAKTPDVPKPRIPTPSQTRHLPQTSTASISSSATITNLAKSKTERQLARPGVGDDDRTTGDQDDAPPMLPNIRHSVLNGLSFELSNFEELMAFSVDSHDDAVSSEAPLSPFLSTGENTSYSGSLASNMSSTSLTYQSEPSRMVVFKVLHPDGNIALRLDAACLSLELFITKLVHKFRSTGNIFDISLVPQASETTSAAPCYNMYFQMPVEVSPATQPNGEVFTFVDSSANFQNILDTYSALPRLTFKLSP